MNQSIGIIGAGPSGLIALKYLLEYTQNVTIYEKTNQIGGAWAFSDETFVSTSTKYTTQFACYSKYALEKNENAFFKGDEYGKYLTDFVNEFSLFDKIKFNSNVKSIKRVNNCYNIRVNDKIISHDVIIICSGLTKSKNLDTFYEQKDLSQNQQIVVIGGGESAVDIATKYAKSPQIC